MTASALSCISGTSSSTSVIRSVEASAIMIIVNTKVTIIRDIRIWSAYTITLVSSPVCIVPLIILSPPISTMTITTVYTANCMIGEFHATIFSAFVNSLNTIVDTLPNFSTSWSPRTYALTTLAALTFSWTVLLSTSYSSNTLTKCGCAFFAIKISAVPRTGATISMTMAIGILMVIVMIRESMIMIGALASRRMVNIYAICTFVISVVILVTRLDVEKWSMFPNENSCIR